ncbi:chaperone NapD [Jiella marina]|uniref:chaperone NapD n=1 Tax=Jiella sp. LLJ827 TaxID=2917712 RepID=UPI0021010C98|nr:chaperone NapD [Jiella sp. LLJ827]MCQ0988820.1 chaperone NapD [Jiella sp. LLJ827]
MAEPIVISSLFVQVRPERLRAVAVAILAERGAEISAEDASGKLVVVLESETDAALARSTEKITKLAGVLSVGLVFHHTDAGAPRVST